MTVLDEAKERIVSRLKELEPQRREYDDLLGAAEKLGVEYLPDGHAQAVGAGRARRTARAGGRRAKAAGERKIAPPGQRREEVLEAVKAEPGITVAAIAAKLGLPDATSLYRVQRQLVKEKAIRKEGAKMFAS